MAHLSGLPILIGLLWLCLDISPLAAHRDPCHRWHSCPSDHDTYICGDTGRCNQCPDNDYCLSQQPRLRTAPDYQETFRGDVVEIVDGDTLSVLCEGCEPGKHVKIRLHGIDAPEKGQPFGTRSHLYACELATRQMVTVRVQDTDRYGRLVADVILPDGRSLNREMVSAGVAWWYRQYAPDNVALAQLEAGAKAAKRGLWSDLNPMPPWTWRQQER